MVTAPSSPKFDTYSERVNAARPLINFKTNYASLKDVIADVKQQLQQADFRYGVMQKPHRVTNVPRGSVSRHIHHLLAKPVWDTLQTSATSPLSTLLPFNSVAKTEAIRVAFGKLIILAIYADSPSLDYDITTQLSNHNDYSFPQFSDVRDREVESIIIDGVAKHLLDNKMVTIRTQYPPAPSVAASGLRTALAHPTATATVPLSRRDGLTVEIEETAVPVIKAESAPSRSSPPFQPPSSHTTKRRKLDSQSLMSDDPWMHYFAAGIEDNTDRESAQSHVEKQKDLCGAE
jgi:hypothetical protein